MKNKRKRASSQNLKMRSVFLVFCEGETEKNYLEFLRRQYRPAIQIKPIKIGNNISKSKIDRIKRNELIHPNDNIVSFLMFDMDVEELNEKLKECDGIKICSNPCFELWFLLHIKNQTAAISSKKVIDELISSNNVWQNYNKGILSDSQEKFLSENLETAIKRAKTLKTNNNPSTEIYKLIDEIILNY